MPNRSRPAPSAPTRRPPTATWTPPRTRSAPPRCPHGRGRPAAHRSRPVCPSGPRPGRGARRAGRSTIRWTAARPARPRARRRWSRRRCPRSGPAEPRRSSPQPSARRGPLEPRRASYGPPLLLRTYDDAMTRLMSVQAVVPVHKYSQAQLTTAFADLIASSGPYDHPLLERFHANTGVKSRHLALPLERYAQLADFDQSNDAFIEVAVELGAEAVTRAVQAAGLRPEDVDLVLSTTITGLAVPSIEARIAGRVGLRDDVKRLPLVGLGCAAGAAGIGRMHDYLLGHPREVAVLLAVELCSLTVQRGDR